MIAPKPLLQFRFPCDIILTMAVANASQLKKT